MFHGREVYAEDLIGLRVAKTFAGLGRFLGQVVKFDNRAALYTVVYADGDAEDLSIDSTLQILIQNEIERADPAQVPPAISLLFKKVENPFASRWSNGPPVGGYPEASEYHRRFVDSPLWRERGDSYLSVDRTLDAHPRSRARAEGRFPHRINPRNAVDGTHASGTSSGTPTGYKYRDSMDSPSGGQTSPMTGIPGYPQYAPLRTKHDITAGDYRINDVASRSSAAPRVSRETASFMSPTDTLGANAAFSMVDVDRISQSRPGSGHIEQQLRGRSPRHPDAQQGYHRRTGSGHSYHNQRGNEDHYMGEGASESQGELHNAPTSAPSQQHN
ncbi:hypothetical protein BBJ29_006661 [Phytophthora kernoviae]|uniref:PTM/DIR17-like Tudor domain-containing protein n=1 Tax=Phytophthora kernoviae TaxID=325452 RepID=A0A3F2RP67_9STRA|nr:hypothetical protein BBP00_00006024 [Phytophthora kernoviae]RLN60511.1 hypothetical protein BBJ29_006661 [Phytophthora kernoviae]